MHRRDRVNAVLIIRAIDPAPPQNLPRRVNVRQRQAVAQMRGCDYAGLRMEGGFAPTFKEAVGRWRRRHRHPPANETWFAVHYRVGWLVERLNTLESIHLMRQGLDVRSLAAERPARKRKGEGLGDGDNPADAGESTGEEELSSGSEPAETEPETETRAGAETQPVTTSGDC